MLTLPLPDGKIAVGGILFDPREETLRSAREIIEILLQDVVRPVFGDRFSVRFPPVACYPAPGRPDRAWAVLYAADPDLTEDRPFAPWEPWPEFVGRWGRADPRRITIVIGQITADGGSVVGTVSPQDATWSPVGVFRFRPAVSAVDGGLVLPGNRVRPDGSIVMEPGAGPAFQGFWSCENGPRPVSGFRIAEVPDQEPPLHPAGNPDTGKPDDVLTDGFLVWGDPASGRALWAVFPQKPSLPWPIVGRLELVDLLSMEKAWEIPGVPAEGIAFLPDGRWAAIRSFREPSSGRKRMELVVGIRERFVVRSIPFTPRPELTVHPLPDGCWLLVSPSWLLIMDGLTEQTFVDAPIHPLLCTPDAVVVDDGERIAAVPDRETSLHRFIESAFEMRSHSVRIRDGEAIVRSSDMFRLLMIPPGRILHVDQHIDSVHGWDFRRIGKMTVFLEWGDAGWNRRNMARIVFIGPEGQTVRDETVEGFTQEDTLDVVAVLGMILVAMTLYGTPSDPTGLPMEVVLMTFEGNGDLRYRKAFRCPRGRLRLVGKFEMPDIAHVFLAVSGDRELTVCVTVEPDGDMNVSIIA